MTGSLGVTLEVNLVPQGKPHLHLRVKRLRGCRKGLQLWRWILCHKGCHTCTCRSWDSESAERACMPSASTRRSARLTSLHRLASAAAAGRCSSASASSSPLGCAASAACMSARLPHQAAGGVRRISGMHVVMESLAAVLGFASPHICHGMMMPLRATMTFISERAHLTGKRFQDR